MRCDEVVIFVISRAEEIRLIRAAKASHRFHDHVKNRLEVDRGAADDLEHVSGCGELVDRAGQLRSTVLQFAEQARVLDRDDRLVGKGAHQFDLPLGERFDPLPGKRDNADWLAVAQERHPKGGTSRGRHNLGHRQIRVSAEVRDMHDFAFERYPPGDAVATGDNGSLAYPRPILGVRCHIGARHIAVDLALAYAD